MRLATITLLVRDYDEAIAWFQRCLGFQLREDTRLSEEKRWVRMAPSVTGSAEVLLARASTPAQMDAVGRQAGGRVAFFLETGTFDADLARMSAEGVTIADPPRTEPYGRVVVFEDLFGNRWDLIEPAGEHT